MPLNALLLPLIGAFLFLSIFRRTSYFLGRQSAAMVSFWVASGGLLLLIASRILILALAWAMADPAAAGRVIFDWVLPPLLFVACVGIFMGGHRSRPAKPTGIRWKILVATVILLVYGLGHSYILGGSALEAARNSVLWFAIAVLLLALMSKLAIHLYVHFATLLFRAAVLTFVLLIAFTTVVLESESVIELWKSLARPAHKTIDPEAFATVVIACLLGPMLAVTFNVIYPRTAVAARLAHARVTNSFERLLYDATRRGRMVMLTLSSGKVYCGWVNWMPGNPRSQDAYIEILPALSGYREEESHQVRLPVNYLEHYTKAGKRQWREFKKVIPLANIVTAGEFEIENFERFATRGAT